MLSCCAVPEPGTIKDSVSSEQGVRATQKVDAESRVHKWKQRSGVDVDHRPLWGTFLKASIHFTAQQILGRCTSPVQVSPVLDLSILWGNQSQPHTASLLSIGGTQGAGLVVLWFQELGKSIRAPFAVLK